LFAACFPPSLEISREEGGRNTRFVRSSNLVRSSETTHTQENPTISTTADNLTRNCVDTATLDTVKGNSKIAKFESAPPASTVGHSDRR
jgi:hypothetical protein